MCRLLNISCTFLFSWVAQGGCTGPSRGAFKPSTGGCPGQPGGAVIFPIIILIFLIKNTYHLFERNLRLSSLTLTRAHNSPDSPRLKLSSLTSYPGTTRDRDPLTTILQLEGAKWFESKKGTTDLISEKKMRLYSLHIAAQIKKPPSNWLQGSIGCQIGMKWL